MTSPAAGHDFLSRIEEFIGPELQDVEAVYFGELETARPCVRDVLAHVSRFRGKRLRPILVLLSASACGGIRRAHVVLAAVVEMIHTATLVHDDVLDDAATRRHVATVNSRWNTETSVLLGDYLFTHAFHLASSLETTEACRLIGRATNLVCEGELAQIHERGNFALGEDEYLAIIDGKTAELCALCCDLGARYAGAAGTTVTALARYGRALGMAFQIVDDLLDLLGDEKETGKSLGSDLEKQKLTLPVIRLLQQADETTRAEIAALLARPRTDSRSGLLEFIRRSDALEYTRSRATQFVLDARSQLAGLPDSPARRILEEITEFVTDRSF